MRRAADCGGDPPSPDYTRAAEFERASAVERPARSRSPANAATPPTPVGMAPAPSPMRQHAGVRQDRSQGVTLSVREHLVRFPRCWLGQGGGRACDLWSGLTLKIKAVAAQVRQSAGPSGLRSSVRCSGSSVAGGLGSSPPEGSPGF